MRARSCLERVQPPVCRQLQLRHEVHELELRLRRALRQMRVLPCVPTVWPTAGQYILSHLLCRADALADNTRAECISGRQEVDCLRRERRAEVPRL